MERRAIYDFGELVGVQFNCTNTECGGEVFIRATSSRVSRSGVPHLSVATAKPPFLN